MGGMVSVAIEVVSSVAEQMAAEQGAATVPVPGVVQATVEVRFWAPELGEVPVLVLVQTARKAPLEAAIDLLESALKLLQQTPPAATQPDWEPDSQQGAKPRPETLQGQ